MILDGLFAEFLLVPLAMCLLFVCGVYVLAESLIRYLDALDERADAVREQAASKRRRSLERALLGASGMLVVRTWLIEVDEQHAGAWHSARKRMESSWDGLTTQLLASPPRSTTLMLGPTLVPDGNLGEALRLTAERLLQARPRALLPNTILFALLFADEPSPKPEEGADLWSPEALGRILEQCPALALIEIPNGEQERRSPEGFSKWLPNAKNFRALISALSAVAIIVLTLTLAWSLVPERPSRSRARGGLPLAGSAKTAEISGSEAGPWHNPGGDNPAPVAASCPEPPPCTAAATKATQRTTPQPPVTTKSKPSLATTPQPP